MPAAKKVRANPILDIPAIAPGVIDPELLAALLAEPDADYTAGQLARLGDAFAVIGEQLTAAAKDAISPQIEGMVGASSQQIDHNVLFKWTAPGKPSRVVDTAAIKKFWPDCPANSHLYRNQAGRSAYISITL